MATNEQPARSTVLGRIVFTVVVMSAPLGTFPVIASAQLLDRASGAARGGSDPDDGGRQGSDGGQEDRSSGDDDGNASRDAPDGLLGSASRAARGDSSGGRASSRGGAWGGSGRGGSGWSDGHHGFRRSRPAVPYQPVVVGVTIDDPQRPAPAFAARLELEGGYVLAGAGRVGAGARLELPWSMDLALRYSIFVEPLEGGYEALALGRAGLAWRVADEEAVVVRLGAGLRHLQDHAGGLFGADVVLGVDLFPSPPVIVSLEAGAGFVGQALLVQARATLGFALDGCELYVGYDFQGLWSGSTSVDLGGPMLGVRAWL